MKLIKHTHLKRRSYLSAFEIVQVIFGFGMYTIAVITLSIQLQNKDKKK